MPEDSPDGGAPAPEGGAPAPAPAPDGGAPAPDAGSSPPADGASAAPADGNAPADGQNASVPEDGSCTDNSVDNTDQACVVPHDQDDPSSNPDCTYTDATIVVGGTSTLNSSTLGGTMALIAGPSSDKKNVTISLQSQTGPCGDHSAGNVFSISAPTVNTNSNTSSNLDIDITSSFQARDDWTAEDILLQHTPDTLSLAITTCGKSENLTINVYPDYSYTANFTMDFGSKSLMTDPDTGASQGQYMGSAGESLSFTKSFDGAAIDTIGASFKQMLSNGATLTDAIQNLCSWLNQSVGGSFSISLVLPKVSLTGNWGYVVGANQTVTKQGTATLSATPFIGITFIVSLLKAGLAAAGCPPYVTQIPQQITEWTGGKVKVDVDITASATGAANITFVQPFDGTNYTVTPSVTITLTLEAHATAAGKTAVISCSLTGSASAAATFTFGVSFTQIVYPQGTATLGFGGLDVTFVMAGDVTVGMIKASTGGTQKFTPITATTFWTKSFNVNAPS